MENLRRAPIFIALPAGNTIPFSSALRRYARSAPYLRNARGFIDTMLKNVPDYSETLPPTRDITLRTGQKTKAERELGARECLKALRPQTTR